MKKPNETLEVVFTDGKGNFKSLHLSAKELYMLDSDTIHDRLCELDECTSSGCNNESQNFCDCPSVYEDYEFSGIKF